MHRERVSKDPAAHFEKGRAYRAKNRERIFAAALVRSNERRAARGRAVPVWANKRAVLDMYLEARRKTKETGVTHHVDHIVPLISKGRVVCGLHWEGNMQVIPATENMAKGGRVWPDMP